MVSCPYCGEELEESGGLYRCTNSKCPIRSSFYDTLENLETRAIAMRETTRELKWGKEFYAKLPGELKEWVKERAYAWRRKYIEHSLLQIRCPSCRKKGVLIIDETAGMGTLLNTKVKIPAEFVCTACGAHGDINSLLPKKILVAIADKSKRYGLEILKEIARGWKGEKGPARPPGGEFPREDKKYYTERYFKWVGRGIGKSARYGFDKAKYGFGKAKDKWRDIREKRRSVKKADEEKVGGSKLGRILKAPFKAAKETTRFPFRMVGKGILKLRAPRVKRKSRLQGILTTLIVLVIGASISAAVGNLFFMFAFILFIGYHVLPEPGDPVKKIIQDVENQFNEERNELYEKLNKTQDQAQRKSIERELDRLEMRMNRQIEFRVGNPWGIFKQAMSSGGIAAREIMRWGAYALLALAFLTSTFPLAKPIGLILSFVFYFAIGGEY